MFGSNAKEWLMPELNAVVNEIADICYVDQLRSDAAFHKKRDIKSLLLKLKGSIVDEEEGKRRDLERRLYIAEKAVADNEL
jgi:hypothetical protein